MLFGRSSRELFPPRCFYLFLKIPHIPLSYPRCDGDHFPQKIYILPRGELRGYCGILDEARAHIVWKNLTFPCEKSGSYLRASRLTPGTVEAKPRTNRALASQISAPLSSCVPSCPPSVPNSTRFSGASKVSGTDAVYDDLLEPIPSPPVSSVLGEIEFGRKPLFESDCSLAAAALNPGMLKSGKVMRLNKSLYGLKQASRTWHAHLTTCLQRLGFEQCMTDVYICFTFDRGWTCVWQSQQLCTSMIFLR